MKKVFSRMRYLLSQIMRAGIHLKKGFENQSQMANL
jgi:hypothetical protein